MSQFDRKRATYADLVALPENVLGQLIDGELIALPHPPIPYVSVASRLGILLGINFMEGIGSIGGWQFMWKPELHFGEDVLVPVHAGWHAAEPPEKDRAFFTVAPDWLCEILTPSTAALARDRKLPIYARAKVKHAWLLDLEARSLEVFRLRETRWEPAGSFRADARVRAEPFDAIELDLGLLWV